jgi:hypothetical protein
MDQFLVHLRQDDVVVVDGFLGDRCCEGTVLACSK